MTPHNAFRFRLDMLRSSLDVIDLALAEADVTGISGFAQAEWPIALADAREAIAELAVLVELLAPARPIRTDTGRDARGMLAELKAGLPRKL